MDPIYQTFMPRDSLLRLPAEQQAKKRARKVERLEPYHEISIRYDNEAANTANKLLLKQRSLVTGHTIARSTKASQLSGEYRSYTDPTFFSPTDRKDSWELFWAGLTDSVPTVAAFLTGAQNSGALNTPSKIASGGVYAVADAAFSSAPSYYNIAQEEINERNDRIISRLKDKIDYLQSSGFQYLVDDEGDRETFVKEMEREMNQYIDRFSRIAHPTEQEKAAFVDNLNTFHRIIEMNNSYLISKENVRSKLAEIDREHDLLEKEDDS